MGLGFAIGTGGGDGADFLPVVKYDARSGRVSKVDRMMGDDPKVTEIKNFKAVFDLENVEVGWMHFAAGQAPSMILVKLGDVWPDQPSPDHKRGARVVVKLTKADGGDIREMCGNSASFLRGLDELHNAYDRAKGANPGKLPVVAMTDTVAVVSKGKSMSSTNYQPVFEIVSWTDRGDFAPNLRGTATVTIARPAAPSTGSTPVGAPVTEDEDEFA